MLYRTCDHYLNESYDIIYDSEEKKECFICFDCETNHEKMIRLKYLDPLRYDKKCKCDGWVHHHCLEKWCNAQKKCPICRQYIDIDREQNIYIYVTDISGHNLFIFFISRMIQFSVLIFKMVCFISYLYFCYECYFLVNVQIKKYLHHENDH